MNSREIFGLIILLVCAIFISGCGDDEADDRARLETMEEEILLFVGEPECSDSTDCRSIGLGAKPCGGPWRYLIYSIANVDSVDLVLRVAEFNEFNRVLNRRYGWISDCSVPNKPNLGCQDGRCVDLGYQP
jgi:hypothetical protein